MGEATAPAARSGALRGLVPYFARNPVAANLLMALMLAGGLSAGLQLTAQVFPTIDPGVVTVRVPYPGATPTEVEEGITRRVEEAVFGIDGVDRVLSTATENLGTVTIELKDFVDDAQVRDDVEAAVERLVDFPPQDAEQAEVERGSRLSDVLTLVVSSELPEAELVRGAEALEEALLRVPSVSLVALRGARDYEIAIEVREEALRRYDLTIGQVADAVRRSSLNLSSGELRTEAGDLLLRTNTKRLRGDEFGDIVLRARPDGARLRLPPLAASTSPPPWPRPLRLVRRRAGSRAGRSPAVARRLGTRRRRAATATPRPRARPPRAPTRRGCARPRRRWSRCARRWTPRLAG